MALVFNPDTLRYDWVTGPGDIESDPRAALAGGVVGSLDPSAQFGAAARRQFGSYADRPFMSRAIASQYQPQYGQYLMGYGGVTGASDPLNFADYLRGLGTASPSNATWSPMAAPTYGSAGYGDWQNLLRVAETLGTGYGGPQAGQTGAQSQQAYDRWADVLGNTEMTNALISMAQRRDAQPLGSIYGNLRQQGLERMRNQFLADAGPAATNIDWLNYISTRPEMLGSTSYRRDPEYVETNA